ncbi:hypothetical protein [Kitasatospora cineracea]|uniref:hypothetical protein n=1 Tax=Kitasatospora cineracea TaxID=88074 RepID=UPI00381EC1FD
MRKVPMISEQHPPGFPAQNTPHPGLSDPPAPAPAATVTAPAATVTAAAPN